MICIIAGNYSQAKKWAASQMLADNEWFYTLEREDILSRENFHIIVLESAAELHPAQFERIYSLAKIRGRINRK